jgi:hypothetical protein
VPFDGQALTIWIMSLGRSDLYKAHVQNLRAVDSACTQVYRQLKQCLAGTQDVAASALLKTLTLLLGAWSEVRLLKLIYEPQGFSDREQTRILGAASKIDQWRQSIEVGFRRSYSVPRAELSPASLPATAYFRYQEMVSLVDNDLRPIIEIRNKLAHGQWARTLNNQMDDISPEMMAILNTENALSANFKKRILESLSRIVHDLVTSERAFDRDFDTHYRTLHQAKINLKTRSFPLWVASLKEKYTRSGPFRQPN